MSRTLPSPRYRASRLDIQIERTSSKLLLQGDPCLAHFGLNDPSNIYGAGEQSPATNDAAPSTKQVSKGEKISTEIMYDIKVSCTICSISMTCPTRKCVFRNHRRPHLFLFLGTDQLQEKSPKNLQCRKYLNTKKSQVGHYRRFDFGDRPASTPAPPALCAARPTDQAAADICTETGSPGLPAVDCQMEAAT